MGLDCQEAIVARLVVALPLSILEHAMHGMIQRSRTCFGTVGIYTYNYINLCVYIYIYVYISLVAWARACLAYGPRVSLRRYSMHFATLVVFKLQSFFDSESQKL